MHKLLEQFNTIDKLTPALRMVRRELVKTLKLLPDYASFGGIPFETFKKVLEELGFVMEDDWDSNGWKHDTWVKFINCDKDIIYEVTSSWYDSLVTLTKKEYDPE